jgi:hypothetical protein
LRSILAASTSRESCTGTSDVYRGIRRSSRVDAAANATGSKCSPSSTTGSVPATIERTSTCAPAM